ncbi:MAG: hypothetical protein B6D76_05100 [gamma proteobacterium symbiont of Stewartia floridana]|nr:MAG: hypothetical protein B6D76_05100 [gamma proteobacterium symbiont of Stewartia floridana]RLW57093.1 MAG: hypothetical protein B6D75_18590 [gamma proteobacterium symbiont of Stewartia floridana]
MSDRTGTDYLITQLGAVWTLCPLTANHACMVFGSDANTAELVLIISQTGMMFSTLFCFEQYFQWDIKSFLTVHLYFFNGSPSFSE